jgi:hypothetical protein
MEIIKLFGDKQKYLAALSELKDELYRVAWFVNVGCVTARQIMFSAY